MGDRNRSRRVYSFYRAPPAPSTDGTTIIINGGGVTQSQLTGIWIDSGSIAGMKTTGSISIDSNQDGSGGRNANQIGTNVHFFVSGTNSTVAITSTSKVAVLPDTYFSGGYTLGSALTYANPGSGIEAFTGASNPFTRIWGSNNSCNIILNAGINQYGCSANLYHSFVNNAAQEQFRIQDHYDALGDNWATVIVNPRGASFGTDAGFFVSGSIGATSGGSRRVAVFATDVVFSGSVTALSGITSLLGNESLPILAGISTVDQTTFQTVAAFEFNPTGAETMAPSGSTTYTAFFQPIIEVFPTGTIAVVELYNVTSNSYLPASLMSSSAVSTTRLKSSNLSGSLSTGSNIYEMHMRITDAVAGTATCKGAKLFVTWQ